MLTFPQAVLIMINTFRPTMGKLKVPTDFLVLSKVNVAYSTTVNKHDKYIFKLYDTLLRP